MITVIDMQPTTSDFLSDVKASLGNKPPSVSSKYFYDKKGSELFDSICGLPEYYPARAEKEILALQGTAIAQCVEATGAYIIELGSGSNEKAELLLQSLPNAVGYMSVDISKEFLISNATELHALHPQLEVTAVCADYHSPSLAEAVAGVCKNEQRLLFFPGSTIGNLSPVDAVEFLKLTAGLVQKGEKMIVGVDLSKETEILERAYNDAAGVTAEFNLNLLQRMNTELGAHFSIENWAHRAFFNQNESRIEMHLVSLTEQVVTLDDRVFYFSQDQTIHTENSYKYTPSAFQFLASRSGFVVKEVLFDKGEKFSVQILEKI